MVQIDPSALIRTLNTHCTKCLETAAGTCVARGHYEVTVEHVLAQLLADPNADLYLILRHHGVDQGRLEAALQRQLEAQRTGNTGRPVLSPLLLTWLQDTWMLASTELKQLATRSGALLAALVASPHSYTSGAYLDLLTELHAEQLRRELPTLTAGSVEDDQPRVGATPLSGPTMAGPHSRGLQTALGRFTNDFTAQARAGELDPVVGRETEIRQCIDILARRRKNNPIIVGEAGTGKTALVEGIAQRVVQGAVPSQLAGVDILGLDLGLLQAGAGVKGEFENRLKSVIEEVKSSPTPIILFIDEAHTIIGAGGPAGGSDAANLLKPSLARGELRTLAATTWSEYKKYFEKDPALTRRFQLVKVDEPSEDNCIAMMRGLAPHYEKDHGIRIRDDAVVAAVQLSNRYISGRQLPDKAVDLIDTCAARVSIGQESKPAILQDLEHSIQVLEREEVALLRERDEGYLQDRGQLQRVEQDLEATRAQQAEIERRWLEQQQVLRQLLELRDRLSDPGQNEAEEQPPPTPLADGAQPPQDSAGAAEPTPDPTPLSPAQLQTQLLDKQHELELLQQEGDLVHLDVTKDLVASVVSDWTGIPVGKMVQDEAVTLLQLEQRIAERIKGQDYALKQIAESIRSAKMGLGNPRAPIGVFLLVGPSGVGKTETGRVLADMLFGGERFMVSINMSEFQEKHTVSRLIGSPPGYVGYGEGGVLTEAVRQRPYSAVMLDEVEKADPEVMNLFYQVFDKGELSDGEGRVIDFRNTVLLLTSNLGSELMTQMCMQPPPPTRKQVMDAIRPLLVQHFKAALLARMTVIPYFPLSANAMREIVDLKLELLRERMQQTHRITLEISDKVAEQITMRCSEVETGARNIDHIMSRTLLPLLSRAMLSRMSEGPLPSSMALDLTSEGEYALSFADPGDPRLS